MQTQSHLHAHRQSQNPPHYPHAAIPPPYGSFPRTVPIPQPLPLHRPQQPGNYMQPPTPDPHSAGGRSSAVGGSPNPAAFNFPPLPHGLSPGSMQQPYGWPQHRPPMQQAMPTDYYRGPSSGWPPGSGMVPSPSAPHPYDAYYGWQQRPPPHFPPNPNPPMLSLPHPQPQQQPQQLPPIARRKNSHSLPSPAQPPSTRGSSDSTTTIAPSTVKPRSTPSSPQQRPQPTPFETSASQLLLDAAAALVQSPQHKQLSSPDDIDERRKKRKREPSPTRRSRRAPLEAILESQDSGSEIDCPQCGHHFRRKRRSRAPVPLKRRGDVRDEGEWWLLNSIQAGARLPTIREDLVDDAPVSRKKEREEGDGVVKVCVLWLLMKINVG